jgi:copper chaperone CopZ
MEKAVKSVDPNAGLPVGLQTGHVDVRSNADAERIAEAIRSAGYENQSIAA